MELSDEQKLIKAQKEKIEQLEQKLSEAIAKKESGLESDLMGVMGTLTTNLEKLKSMDFANLASSNRIEAKRGGEICGIKCKVSLMESGSVILEFDSKLEGKAVYEKL